MREEDYSIDIPELFFSDTDGKPFEHCQVCGKFLLEPGNSYVIEKAFKNYKGYDFNTTLFEYAICLDCHMQLQKTMSDESVSRLQQYYMEIMSRKDSLPFPLASKNFELDRWISNCFFKGEPVKEMEEFQLVAQFNGNKMVTSVPPMVVGEQAMEEMAELLSDKTIDELNNFRDRYLGPDPALEELFSRKKLLLI
ncbi:MAG: hypothetical protein P8100_01585 [bacterium]|jgi:hypothetical protein